MNILTGNTIIVQNCMAFIFAHVEGPIHQVLKIRCLYEGCRSNSWPAFVRGWGGRTIHSQKLSGKIKGELDTEGEISKASFGCA